MPSIAEYPIEGAAAVSILDVIETEGWGGWCWCWCGGDAVKLNHLQLNKYETEPYFLQFFQSNTTVCLIIHAFCKVYEREIAFVLICRTGRTISGSQLLQNTWIIKQTVVLFWKNWKKCGSFSYSFSCPTYTVKTTFINGELETHVFRECYFCIQCVGTFANGFQSLYESAFKIASK